MQDPIESPGSVQVHSLHVPSDLQNFHPSAHELARYLSEYELNRYQRYRVQKKKTEFYLARKFIKSLVAGIMHLDVRSIELRPDSSGKPFLFAGGREVSLYCNLSHTQGLISCVISHMRNTGIDAEFQEGLHDDLVQRFFHAREIDDYMLLDSAARIQRFYSLWTLKEAYVKAIGQGLYMALDSFWFSLPGDGEVKGIEIHGQQHMGRSSHPFQFFLSRPTTKHTLALAVQAEKGEAPEEFHYSLAADTSFGLLPI